MSFLPSVLRQVRLGSGTSAGVREVPNRDGGVTRQFGDLAARMAAAEDAVGQAEPSRLYQLGMAALAADPTVSEVELAPGVFAARSTLGVVIRAGQSLAQRMNAVPTHTPTTEPQRAPTGAVRAAPLSCLLVPTIKTDPTT